MAGSTVSIALVGLRGSGKTTVGRLLAQLLAFDFCDLDKHLVTIDYGVETDAGELLARIGVERFRELEARSLSSCLAWDQPVVLATGGGVIEAAENRDLLCRRTRCVWLDADAGVLHERICGDPTRRPALTDLDPLEEIRVLAERRAPLYGEVAEFCVQTSDREPSAVANEIFTKLHQ